MQSADKTITVQPGSSIQKALDEAPDGAVVQLTEGRWIECIHLKKNVTLRGQGSGRTVIEPNDGNEPSLFVLAGSDGVSPQVTIEDLKVIRTHGDWYGYAIFAQDNAEVQILNCIVSESTGGIGAQHTAHLTIKHCTILGNDGYGIMLRDSAKARILSSHISTSVFTGVFSDDQSEVTVEDTILSDNSAGIAITRGTIRRCTIRGNKDGVRLRNVSEATIEDNEISNNRGFGVTLGDEPGPGLPPDFIGWIAGRGNRLIGSSSGDFRPKDLKFLATKLGGEIDRRSERIRRSEPLAA